MNQNHSNRRLTRSGYQRRDDEQCDCDCSDRRTVGVSEEDGDPKMAWECHGPLSIDLVAA